MHVFNLRQKPNVLSFSGWQSTGKYLKHVNVNEMLVILKRRQYSKQYSNIPNERFYTRVGTPKYLITKPIENQVNIVTTLVTRSKAWKSRNQYCSLCLVLYTDSMSHYFEDC